MISRNSVATPVDQVGFVGRMNEKKTPLFHQLGHPLAGRFEILSMLNQLCPCIPDGLELQRVRPFRHHHDGCQTEHAGAGGHRGAVVAR